MPRLVTIADAIVTALNGHAFSVPFIAERKYAPTKALDESGELQVFVRPRGFPSELVSNEEEQVDYVAQIVVHQRIDGYSDPESIDALIGLCEEIATFLLGSKLDTDATCDSVTVGGADGAYDDSALRERRIFEAVLTASVSGYLV